MVRYLWVFLISIFFVAGCSVQQKSEPEPVETRVTPLPLTVSGIGTAESGPLLAALLLKHYQEGPAYSMSVPIMLSSYQSVDTLRSPDRKQLLQTYRSPTRWGFVSVISGDRPIVNAFSIVNEQGQRYALVLRGMKFCLVADASRAPFWGGSSWVHSSVNAGKFECSGRTRGSLFTPFSGMPGGLGIYYTEGDTVLYDTDINRLRSIVDLLAQQFTQLRVPAIN